MLTPLKKLNLSPDDLLRATEAAVAFCVKEGLTTFAELKHLLNQRASRLTQLIPTGPSS